MKLPEHLTHEYARKLIKKLGMDARFIQDDWCWGDFAEVFPNPDFYAQIRSMIEQMDNNPPKYIYAANAVIVNMAEEDWLINLLEETKNDMIKAMVAHHITTYSNPHNKKYWEHYHENSMASHPLLPTSPKSRRKKHEPKIQKSA